jgi:regulatory protein
MKDSEPDRGARAAAQRLLAYRPRSEAELRKRLSRRYPPSAVDGALESLKRAGLVDDTAFAQLWTESRVTHRPRSAALIRRELLQKGVSSGTVEAAVDGVDDAENAYRAAARLAERLRDESREVFRRRVWAYLQRRGFGYSAVRSAASRLWDETRDGASAPPADAGCR